MIGVVLAMDWHPIGMSCHVIDIVLGWIGT